MSDKKLWSTARGLKLYKCNYQYKEKYSFVKTKKSIEFYETNPSCRVQGKTVVTARGQAYLEPGREMASRATTPIPTDFFSQTDQQVSKDGALSSQNHFKTYNTISHDCT